MKKNKNIVCLMLAFVMVCSMSLPTFATNANKDSYSESKLKQFVSNDFGTMLVATLLFEGCPLDEYYLLEPIYINTTERIDNPNIIFPVTDRNGCICYTYVVGYVNGYVSSMSSRIALLLNEVLKHDSENIVLYQEGYNIYAKVQEKVFRQKLDGSVEKLSENTNTAILRNINNKTLIPTDIRSNNEYSTIAQQSYLAARNKRLTRQSTDIPDFVMLDDYDERYGNYGDIKYPFITQIIDGEYTGLCWAAATASMIIYEKPLVWGTLTATDIADHLNIGYNTGGNAENVIDALSFYLGSPYLPTKLTRSFTLSEIQTIIGNNDPAYLRIRHRENILNVYRHAVVIIGYYDDGSNNPKIRIMDPLFGFQTCSLNADGDWFTDYTTDPYISYGGVRLFYSQ